jgi:class I fructose-bisphosphate aldolase
MSVKSPSGNTQTAQCCAGSSQLSLDSLAELLGPAAVSLLEHRCSRIPKERLCLPGSDFVDRVWVGSDRSIPVLRSLQALFNHGRLAGTGYLSILPIDQGIEHSAGASFAKNPDYFDPEHILTLGLEGGCNAVATTFGALGLVARRYAHRIPLILKLNHNELLTYPNKHDQVMFAQVRDAWNQGCVAVGATVYFGSPESTRQITEVAQAFSEAHSLGMATILWCYLRNPGFKVGGVNHETSADLSGQANHLGATIEADIVKQKLPESNGGFKALNTGSSSYGKLDERMYTELSSDHPIDLTRYQVANGYMGKVGLINSGGGSGSNDLAEAVRTAVINKRAGGMGLISGRKAFQKPLHEGIKILNAIQDVYLCPEITVA